MKMEFLKFPERVKNEKKKLNCSKQYYGQGGKQI